jgi:hypothetical protein
MYNSTFYLTLVLDGVGGQRHGPAALPPGKTRYQLYGRLGGPQGRSGRVRTVKPIASRYTDYAILAHPHLCTHNNLFFPEQYNPNRGAEICQVHCLMTMQFPKIILRQSYIMEHCGSTRRKTPFQCPPQIPHG